MAEETLEVTTTELVAGAALLSGVAEGSAGGVVDAGAGAAVAAHLQISSPADLAPRPFSAPHAAKTQPIAALPMAACFAGSHWHFRSPSAHPEVLVASRIQVR